MEFVVPEDCGNAPKKLFIKDFCCAAAQGDIVTIAEMITDDISLEIPGHANVTGKDSVLHLLQADVRLSLMSELRIETILTHGAYGAANGTCTFTSGKVVAFCVIYTFNNLGKNAKLRRIQTYSIVFPSS